MQSFERWHRTRRFALSAAVIFGFAAAAVSGQTKLVDKTVATVSDGLRTELITLSDIRWQMALQPGVTLHPARQEDLNTALNLLINQRIFALEAERIPREPPSPAVVDEEIRNTLKSFPSSWDFAQRLRSVGFDSVKDENFVRLMTKRVAIDKYLDFRFRSFIVNSPEEVARYYETVLVPEYRRLGAEIPTLDKKRADIDKLLTETKVLRAIEAFLDDAKRRVEIVIINPI